MKKLAIALMAVMIAAGTASADVIVEDTISSIGSSGTKTVTAGSNLSDASLVVISEARYDAKWPTAIAVGSDPATLLLQQQGGYSDIQVWAIALGSVSAGDIDVAFTGATDKVVNSLFLLSGADQDVNNYVAKAAYTANRADTMSLDMGDLADGSALLSGAVFGKVQSAGNENVDFGGTDGNGAITFTPAGEAILTGEQIYYNNGYASVTGATTSTAGNLVSDNTGAQFGASFASVAVAPIPEPATMSVLALGGLGVLIRRRK
jgi:hypothetical protein